MLLFICVTAENDFSGMIHNNNRQSSYASVKVEENKMKWYIFDEIAGIGSDEKTLSLPSVSMFPTQYIFDRSSHVQSLTAPWILRSIERGCCYCCRHRNFKFIFIFWRRWRLAATWNSIVRLKFRFTTKNVSDLIYSWLIWMWAAISQPHSQQHGYWLLSRAQKANNRWISVSYFCFSLNFNFLYGNHSKHSLNVDEK